jgi:hypothetical protein
MLIDRSQIIAFLRNSSLFRGLDETKIDLVIDRLEIISLEEGSLVFEQGDPSESLFFIFSGKVSLMRQFRGDGQHFMTFNAGDVFGFEIFARSARNRSRQVTARASSPTQLLVINLSGLTALVKMIPGLYNRFSIRVDSYYLSLKVNLKWRRPDEAIYYISHRHPAFLARRFIAPVLAGIAALTAFIYFLFQSAISPVLMVILSIGAPIVWAAWVVWEYIDWSNDYSIITNQRVTFQEKIIWLYDMRREALLSAIRSVDVRTSQVGLVLGYGNVVVHTFAGDIDLENIKFVREVAYLLDEQRRLMIKSSKASNIQSFQQSVRQRLAGKANQPSTEANLQDNIPLNPVKPQRSNYLNMRFEENGTVTYRTHIIVLILRTWFLIFTLLLLVGLGVTGAIARPEFWVDPFARSFWLWAAGILGSTVLGIVIYRLADWRNDIFTISLDQIIDRNKKPFGREEVRVANLSNIEAIRFEQKGLIHLLFNYGTVYVRVGLAELTFDEVFNPSDVQRELFQRIAERVHRQVEDASDADIERMVDYIGAYNQVTREENSKRLRPYS